MIKRAEIIELLFGTEGIVNADDTIDLGKKSVELKNKVKNHPQFINYFDHKLKDRLDLTRAEPTLGTTQIHSPLDFPFNCA